MRLYAANHLERIGLDTWAYQNLKTVDQSPCVSSRADTYYIPTDEAEHLIAQYNTIAALRGIRICRPVYKSTYLTREGKIEWN